MQQKDYEEFRILMQRKAKAMEQTPEVREKYQSQYNQIILRLRQNIRPYVAYYITEGRNNLKPHGSLKHCTEIWNEINEALKLGDLEKLDGCCKMLKKEYETI